jgi:hypothetical protein
MASLVPAGKLFHGILLVLSVKFHHIISHGTIPDMHTVQLFDLHGTLPTHCRTWLGP